MANLTLRLVKAAPLTNAEVDNNFSNINSEVQSVIANVGVLSNLTTAAPNIVEAINLVDASIPNPGTNGNVLVSTGTAWVSQASGPSGATLAIDYSNVTYRIGMTGNTSGAWNLAYLSPSFAFNPSMNILYVPNVVMTGSLINPTFKSYRESIVDLGTISASGNVDLSLGNVFKGTLTSNVTLTFTNHPVAPSTMPVTLILTQGGSGSKVATITGARYTETAQPAFSSAVGNTDVLTYFSPNGGTTFIGTHSHADIQY